MDREIIILAKSNKHGGYCVAGVDTETGEWIRPVTDDVENEGYVPTEDVFYENGDTVEVLDKVKISFVEHSPTQVQPENYLYDRRYFWEKTGTVTIDEVISLRGYDESDYIFCNTERKLEDDNIENTESLLLVNVQDPRLFIDKFNKKKFNFRYKDNYYSFFYVQDPEYKNDEFNMYGSNVNVVFSLTNKHIDGFYYKIVAKIFK